MNESPYYEDVAKIAKLASRISLHFRKKMFEKFLSAMQPQEDYKVLDLGVTNDDRFQESNYFEKLYPYKKNLVCAGVEDGSFLEAKYPGVHFVSVEPHKPLPFADQEFDIVFSNAVIEHVGNQADQKAFVKEMLRVSRAFFLTTPNRWFPIEFHTGWPLLHYLPKHIHRSILSGLGKAYWSKEENLNLLSANELQRLFPENLRVSLSNIRLAGLVTNLIVYGSIN